MNEFKGKLIVFSAPSGSGKTTIVRHLLNQEQFQLEFSISATSERLEEMKKIVKIIISFLLKNLKIKLNLMNFWSGKKFTLIIFTEL